MCGVRSGALYCWGYNLYGQVGDGTTNNVRNSPVQVGSATDWQSVSAGSHFTCGMRGGAAFCFGLNDYGALGDGSAALRSTPVQVGTSTDWALVSGGGAHTCGVRDGGAYCWGNSKFAQIGDGGETARRQVPVPVGELSGLSTLAASVRASCTAGVPASSEALASAPHSPLPYRLGSERPRTG
jgi:alpha-tubulin suppressor-like RCC1 family protein